jgi:alpha-beta hydrolase superfamily lysophospholipase
VQLFTDPLQDEFASWALGYVGSGGADLGEIVAIADAIADSMATPEPGHDSPAGSDEAPDDGAFYDAWMNAVSHHEDAAARAVDAGHPLTARGHWLRAATYAGVAYHPLYGSPVDPRLRSAFDRQMSTFGKAVALGDPPAEALSIPFDGHTLRSFFVPAVGAGRDDSGRRPLLILTNGYDATMADLYLGTGRAATERGYHCLLFDGPGQGDLLVRSGVPLVADWERVVTAVVDAVVDRPDVDPDRIAIHGWSLGGYLAPRAASGEHRLAACVADPPLWGVLDGMRHLAQFFGLSSEAAAALPEISDADAASITSVIEGDRGLNWKLVKRGYWVHGVKDLRGYLAATAAFTMDGRAEKIRCPVLGMTGEGDILAMGAEQFMSQLKVPNELVKYTAAQGAGGHCEMLNRWLVVQRVLDWLDDTLS